MQDTQVLLQSWQTMSSWSSCQEHCYVGTSLSLLFPVKRNCNVIAHKDKLNYHISNFLATVWERITYGCVGQRFTNIWLYSV